VRSPAVPAVGDVGRHRWLPEYSGAGVVWIMGNPGEHFKEITFACIDRSWTLEMEFRGPENP